MGPPRSLPARLQAMLARAYRLDAEPDIDAFVHLVEGGRRESLRVRESDEALELRLELPTAVLAEGEVGLDDFCQVVEGVSHFLFVVERARRELPVTQLELELQAEVDKYLTLAVLASPGGFSPERSAYLRVRLYAEGSYLHQAPSEEGGRYRLANALAGRFARVLEERFLLRGRHLELWELLRRFHGGGQAEKLALAQAA